MSKSASTLRVLIIAARVFACRTLTVHATLHAIVETQIALGDETPARRTTQRLMDAGLDRHETIHAIGWVLIEFMRDLMKAPELGSEPNAQYFAALEWLTVEDWRRSQ